jgi:hypothetical protein
MECFQRYRCIEKSDNLGEIPAFLSPPPQSPGPNVLREVSILAGAMASII